MIVQINPDWRLVSDPLQWKTQRRRFVKGAPKWDNISYHRTLDNAVLCLARRRIRLLGGEYGPEALIPLCQALDSLRTEIGAALGTQCNDPG